MEIDEPCVDLSLLFSTFRDVEAYAGRQQAISEKFKQMLK